MGGWEKLRADGLGCDSAPLNVQKGEIHTSSSVTVVTGHSCHHHHHSPLREIGEKEKEALSQPVASGPKSLSHPTEMGHQPMRKVTSEKMKRADLNRGDDPACLQNSLGSMQASSLNGLVVASIPGA